MSHHELTYSAVCACAVCSLQSVHVSWQLENEDSKPCGNAIFQFHVRADDHDSLPSCVNG